MIRMLCLACVVPAAVTLYACSDRAAPTAEIEIEGGSHRAAVDAAFRSWADGTGSPFKLLSDDVRWTIIGSTLTAGTYDRAGLETLVTPFNDRLAAPLQPTEWCTLGDGEIIAIHFTAEAPLKNGELYKNEYAWFFRFERDQVVEVRAFLDLPKFERAREGEPL